MRCFLPEGLRPFTGAGVAGFPAPASDLIPRSRMFSAATTAAFDFPVAGATGTYLVLQGDGMVAGGLAYGILMLPCREFRNFIASWSCL